MGVVYSEIEESLGQDESISSLEVLPTFMRALPNGSEEGKFLAIDLNEQKLRILLVELHEGEMTTMQDFFTISDSIKKGSGTELFDHIAQCLAEFLKSRNLNDDDVALPLGLTFSFPYTQSDLASASLTKWTNGFSASGVENEDVVQLLREACKRRNDINVDVVVILNETIGTLVSGAFENNLCRIGLIVGDELSVCYVEDLAQCPVYKNLKSSNNSSDMIMRINLGNLGENGQLDFICTAHDAEVDANSENPGKNRFEKLILGKYLDELVRVVLVHLAEKELIFVGDNYDGLRVPFSLSARTISAAEMEMQQDGDRSFERLMEIFKGLGMKEPSQFDCANAAYVCSLVSTRAAQLCAIAVATLISKMEKPCVGVAVNGSMCRLHPKFCENMTGAIRRLIPSTMRFHLERVGDGRGLGAALAAAVVTSEDCDPTKSKSRD